MGTPWLARSKTPMIDCAGTAAKAAAPSHGCRKGGVGEDGGSRRLHHEPASRLGRTRRLGMGFHVGRMRRRGL